MPDSSKISALTVKLQPSVLWQYTLVLFHLGALVPMLWLPNLWSALLLCCLALSFFYQWHRSYQSAELSLQADLSGIYINAAGEQFSIGVGAETIVTPFIVILVMYSTIGNRQHTLLIFPDSIPKAAFKHLQYFLRVFNPQPT